MKIISPIATRASIQLNAIYLLLLSLPILVSVSNPASAQLVLDTCISRARANYPLIKQYDLIENTQEYSFSNANKSFLPQLDLNIIGGVIDGFPSFSPSGQESSSAEFNLITIIQFNQLIWDGGITKTAKEIQEASSSIELAQLETSLHQLDQRVNELFFGILLIDKQVDQLRLLMERLERNRNKVVAALENGIVYKSDLQEIEVQLLNTEQQIASLNYNRSAYLKVLSAMVGESIQDSDSLIVPDEILIDDMVVKRPELKLFESQSRLIEAQARMDKTSLYPKFGLTGFGVFITPGASFGASELTRLLVGGVNIRWSIGGLYKNGNNKRLAELRMQNIQTQRETFLFNNDLELRQKNTLVQQYSPLIQRDKEIVRLKKEIGESYQLKYDNGVATMTELLDKINEENLAKLSLTQHQLQYMKSIYDYKITSGN